ncbi:MAG: hypothetical protein WC346_17765 [Methanogenium sp.]|jgi:hypothetical protein
MKSPLNKRKWKEALAQRQKESNERKDDSGMFKSIFKSTLPRDKQWQASEDEHEINIIPYLAGKNNPNVKEGEPVYNLELFVHRQIGPANDNYICLSKSYGKACPVCDLREKLIKEDCEDEELLRSLKPSKRVIYNIVCLDSPKDIKKGVQVFETSQYLFEKPLIEQATLPKKGGFVPFSDPDEGTKVYFKKKGKGLKTEFTSFQFPAREEEEEKVTDELLSAAFCIENYLHIPTYDEVAKSLNAEGAEKEEGEEQPEDVSDPEDLSSGEEGEESSEEGSEEGEESSEEEGGEEEKEEGEEGEEGSEEGEEKGGEEESSEEGECPVGAIFAVDFDRYENCDDCDLRDECRAKNDEKKKEKLAIKKKEKPVEKKVEKKKEEPPKKSGIRKRPGR